MTLWNRILFHYHSDTMKPKIRRRHDRKNLISHVIEIDRGDKSILGKRKTYHRRDESCINKVRKKQKITGNYGVYDRKGEIDRISELPESIIHHIFTFLRCTKDIARTAVLSKNWRSMFNSYNSFDFDQRWFKLRKGKGKHNRIKAGEVQKKRFRRYVENSIATRLEPLSSIDKFRLYVSNVDLSLSYRILDWLRAAMSKNVKELDIQVYRFGLFILPDDVIVSKSLVSLKLSGTILYDYCVIKMINLRELSIKDTSLLSSNMLKKFEENCPLLEDLRLICCPRITELTILSLVKLRRVEVHDCADLRGIEIAASNLESFWYHAVKNQRCKIDLKGSEKLKNLTLKDRRLTNSAFEDWMFKCPLLEKVALHECNRLEKIKIFSEKLKSLAVIQCEKLCEANIDAPNLYSLEYDGNVMPFRSINASRIGEVKFSFSPTRKPRSKWTIGCRNFFSNLDGLKGFKLVVYSKLNMQIFEEPSKAHLDGNNFEKIELTAASASVVKTVDNWLREWHGNSLILVSSNSELMKLINMMITDREDDPSCCRFYTNKCWRHYLADVQISTLKIGNVTCYDFTWRSRKSC